MVLELADIYKSSGKMKYAIIKNNTVSNIILWNKEKNPEYAPEGLAAPIEEGQKVSIGWQYEGGQFIDPNPPQITDEE